ncbi:CHAT domain-containing protein [Streptomyces sp. S.PB5]|uniref:CHAT domain-containing protein n=1 Tax=Streptomyces sp. S.PB5 TaxID=3020844 RepID=UPI0025AF2C21|nr:CHAT domain-containing protein [Streptomyces sp. S.PB5]MDN3025895.1 CHAT domain-containing protein [Streptomyces sp. S.PB5]
MGFAVHELLTLLLSDQLAAASAGASAELTAAARALAAGEPKRALRQLPGALTSQGAQDTAEALRIAAYTLDLNWYPGNGGAVVMTEEEMRRAGQEPPSPANRGAALVALVAARFLPLVQSARSIADSALTSGETAATDIVLSQLAGLGAELRGHGEPLLQSYLALAVADVAHRSGRFDEAAAGLDACRRLADGDPHVLARLSLLQGDLALTPSGPPELMGERLGPTGPVTPAPDPVAAASHYASAEQYYAKLAAPRGRALVALRRAHSARLSGYRPGRVRKLRQAHEWAVESGDAALSQVVTVHRMLDELDEGGEIPWRELEGIARWSRTEGSTSLARGLVRLFVVRGTAAQAAGRTLTALRCLRSGRRLAAGIDAPVESDLADRAYLDLLDRVNFRRASTVLLAADTIRATAALHTPQADTVTWMRAAELAMSLDGAVEALADPDLKAVAGARLTEVDAAAERLTRSWPPGRMAVEAVRESLRRAPTLLLRYRARRALQAGFREEAHALLERALSDAGDDALLRITLLFELDRRAEAHAGALELFRRGGIHPDHAVELFLRLGDPKTASEALVRLDQVGRPGGTVRPWEEAGRRADLAEAFGDHRTAADLGEEAVARYEQWSSQLVRDVLRTSMTDDVSVAGIYHTAVMARIGLAEQARTTSVRDHEIARAFELSDRCRGIGVEMLRVIDALTSGPSLDAARDWLRAGSAWAAAYEGLVDAVTGDPAHTPSSARLRRSVLAVEEDLERAESRVTRLAPALLAGRRGPRADGASLDAVRDGLTEDARLLMYDTFDDDLLIWIVDREGVGYVRSEVPHRDLACDVRRFHSACASGRRDETAERVLSEQLLDPVSEALGGCRRLYVVPHRSLALVPFHVLPVGGLPLGERCVVSHPPAAALLARPDSGRPPRLDERTLLVGAPAYAPDRRLPELPGTATEVTAIARLLGARPLLGGAATERAVADAASGSTVLHLATHGVVYEHAPHRSHLALSGHDSLTVGDVTGLDLAADLVVLSACHTGRGTATAGGDVVGLVRAAVATGARHVVVSLWPVDDEAGALLMTCLYESLLAEPGTSVAQALAMAQRRVRALDAVGRREAYDGLRTQTGTAAAAGGARDVAGTPVFADDDSNLPYYWAPFIHVGT